MQNNLYSSAKLEWYEVSHYIEKALAKILKEKTVCCAAFEDAEYWSVRIMNRRLSVSELKTLLEFVKADDKTTEDSIPEDSDSAKFIGMRLSSMLLGIALGAHWQECYATKNALWLIGISFDFTYKTGIESKVCLVGDTAADTEKLLSEKEFRKLLCSNGGDYNALVVTAEQNRKNYANYLFWHYPISDGEHTGVYFVLVKEGIITVPYNIVRKNSFEKFVLSDIKLCTASDIANYISEWNKFSDTLSKQLKAFKEYLESK